MCRDGEPSDKVTIAEISELKSVIEGTDREFLKVRSQDEGMGGGWTRDKLNGW